MLNHVVLPNGQPIRIRLDPGVPLDTSRDERIRLLEEAVPPKLPEKEPRWTLCVLGSAIGIFVLLSLGIVVVVAVIWSEVRRASDAAHANAFPAMHELSAFVHTVMNSTSRTVQNVEQMSVLSNALLTESAQTIRVTLNATQDMAKTAENMLAHPPSLQLGIGRAG